MAATRTPAPFNPSTRVLLGPGPSEVPPRVLAAMGYPLLGHLDSEFVALMDETQGFLRQVFPDREQAHDGRLGHGSAGWSRCRQPDRTGRPDARLRQRRLRARMVDVAERAGAKVTSIERPYGEVFDPQEVREAVKKVGPKVVGIVHAETSTGAWQPMEEIARVVHEGGAMIAIDTVTSLGGVPVEIDAWGIDAVYSGTQKCLSCPPGLAPVSFNARAAEVIASRKTKVKAGISTCR